VVGGLKMEEEKVCAGKIMKQIDRRCGAIMTG